MTDHAKTIALRIKELEAAAQKARLKAMQLAALLLTKESALLARPSSNADPSGDLAVLRARYDMAMRVADDVQAQLDKLHADEHDVKYYR